MADHTLHNGTDSSSDVAQASRAAGSTTAPGSGEAWEARLFSALSNQERIVMQLEALGVEQAAAIDSGRTEPLLSILGQRQHLIEAFASTQESVSSMAQELERDPDRLAAASRERARSLVASVSERLRVVMERDARDEARLAEAQVGTRSELTKMDAAHRAHRAYGGVGHDQNRYADTQG